MAEQSRGLYQILNSQSIEDLQRKLNFILAQISNRLDQMEGLRGNPTFYKTALDFLGEDGIEPGSVLRAISATRAEMMAPDADDLSGILTVPHGGTGKEKFTANGILYGNGEEAIGDTNSLASAVLVTGSDGKPSLSTDIPTGATIGSTYIYRAGGTDIPVGDGGLGQSTAIDGLVEGDGVSTYSAATTLSGDLLIKVYDFDGEMIHEYPLEFAGYTSEVFGFY